MAICELNRMRLFSNAPPNPPAKAASNFGFEALPKLIDDVGRDSTGQTSLGKKLHVPE